MDTAAAAADTAAAEPHGRAEAAAPFPRPRGRGPPGCTWDVLKGGWFRADGSAWQKVRNERSESLLERLNGRRGGRRRRRRRSAKNISARRSRSSVSSP